MKDEARPYPEKISAKGLRAPPPRTAPPTAAKPRPEVRRSAAGLTVPKRKSVPKPVPARCGAPRRAAERAALFDRLRALRDAIKPSSSQPDLAIALIEACIAGGICTKPGIVSALVHLHLSNRFAGVMVDNGVKGGRWRKGGDGRYYLTQQL